MQLDNFIRSGWFSLLALAGIVLGAAALDVGYSGAGVFFILAGTILAIIRVMTNIKFRKAQMAEEKKKVKK